MGALAALYSSLGWLLVTLYFVFIVIFSGLGSSRVLSPSFFSVRGYLFDAAERQGLVSIKPDGVMDGINFSDLDKFSIRSMTLFLLKTVSTACPC